MGEAEAIITLEGGVMEYRPGDDRKRHSRTRGRPHGHRGRNLPIHAESRPYWLTENVFFERNFDHEFG